MFAFLLRRALPLFVLFFSSVGFSEFLYFSEFMPDLIQVHTHHNVLVSTNGTKVKIETSGKENTLGSSFLHTLQTMVRRRRLSFGEQLSGLLLTKRFRTI